MNILVTGGAGYIGSHTLVELYKSGHTAVVVDNLCNSNPVALERVAKIAGVENIPFYEVDIRDKAGLEKVFAEKISGKDANRPKLQEMLEFVREGDTVVVHDFSRLAR